MRPESRGEAEPGSCRFGQGGKTGGCLAHCLGALAPILGYHEADMVSVSLVLLRGRVRLRCPGSPGTLREDPGPQTHGREVHRDARGTSNTRTCSQGSHVNQATSSLTRSPPSPQGCNALHGPWSVSHGQMSRLGILTVPQSRLRLTPFLPTGPSLGHCWVRGQMVTHLSCQE